MLALIGLAAVAWLVLLALPFQPWRNRELLAARADIDTDAHDVSVLIPARNEADNLPQTLDALAAQGAGLDVVVVDDGSGDETARIAAAHRGVAVRVIQAQPLPAGWSGKVWAQSEGFRHVDRPLLLLLDADIVLAAGMLGTLRKRLEDDALDLVSVMATLPVSTLWEKLLTPPFIYFFKLLYPFALSNRPGSPVAAAAGGCILVRRDSLADAGGFEVLRDALIDDCTLARRLKSHGCRLWTGQSLDVRSQRGYPRLADFWNMVARTAYTQLRHSPMLLAGASAAMIVLFPLPVLALLGAVVTATPLPGVLAALALLAMMVSYLPTLLLYGVHPLWALSLPASGCLYLLMTWTSAVRHMRGETAHWRGRRYGAGAARLR